MTTTTGPAPFGSELEVKAAAARGVFASLAASRAPFEAALNRACHVHAVPGRVPCYPNPFGVCGDRVRRAIEKASKGKEAK